MSYEDEKEYVGKRLQETEIEKTDEKIPIVQPEKHKSHWWLWVVIPIIAVFVLYGALTAYIYFGNRVFPKVSVLGVSMSNMKQSEALTVWDREGEKACLEHGLTFMDGETELTTEPMSAFGVQYSSEEAVEAALHIGRTEPIYLQGYSFIRHWMEPCDILPETQVNEQDLDVQVEQLVHTAGSTFVEGNYFFDEGDDGNEPGLYITKARTGKQMNASWLKEELLRQFQGGERTAVQCQFDELHATDVDIDQLFQEVDGEVVEATYDRGTGSITRSKPGCTFDVDEVKEQYAQAEEGTTFLVKADVVFPRVSTEEVEAGLFKDVLGTATTKVSGSSTRLGNVKLAASYINGKIYNPGESFWYNATVGERTVERGFGEAPAYFLGKTVMEVGGGICQVSSTLYYATLLANLQIVKRYPHAYIPDYIQAGCDATVSWNGPDFAFKNNTDYPIKIVTNYSSDNELTVTIYGTKVDDTYIEMETRWLSKTDYQIVYNLDTTLALGESVVDQTPYTGYHVVTYKNVYNGDGTLISSTFEADSDYEKRDKIVRCAQDVMPTTTEVVA